MPAQYFEMLPRLYPNPVPVQDKGGVGGVQAVRNTNHIRFGGIDFHTLLFGTSNDTSKDVLSCYCMLHLSYQDWVLQGVLKLDSVNLEVFVNVLVHVNF